SFERGCSEGFSHSCLNPLLRWFHSQMDILAILAYVILFPLKLIVVIILRDDIEELFGEIIYADNQDKYRHWAAADAEEEVRISPNSLDEIDENQLTVNYASIHKKSSKLLQFNLHRKLADAGIPPRLTS
ncbi:hypothetical protein AB6A40_009918, partial [Gnathostoma spinigerum]